MDAQRTAQGIAELTRGEPVLTRKDLDPVPQAGGSLDGYPETQGDVVDIDPALFRQERLLAEDPEVPATSRHLQRSRDAVQLQLALQFSEVEERVVIVGIDGDPFTTLRLRVDGIYADGDPAGQVFADRCRVKFPRLAAILILRLVVVVSSRVRVRVGGLLGVGLAIDEQGPPVADAVRCDRNDGRFWLGEVQSPRLVCGNASSPWLLLSERSGRSFAVMAIPVKFGGYLLVIC